MKLLTYGAWAAAVLLIGAARPAFAGSPLTFTPEAVEFGDVPVGTVVERGLYAINTSGQRLFAMGQGAGFVRSLGETQPDQLAWVYPDGSFQAWYGHMGPGGPLDMLLAVRPQALGDHTVTLQFVFSDEQDPDHPVTWSPESVPVHWRAFDPNAAATPEPGSLVLLALGALPLIRRRRS